RRGVDPASDELVGRYREAFVAYAGATSAATAPATARSGIWRSTSRSPKRKSRTPPTVLCSELEIVKVADEN
ncbi:MAG: hypothetical protein ACSLFD_08180, partial [Solirubrobacterales bacterium]